MAKLSLDSLFNLAANTALLSTYNGTKVGVAAVDENCNLIGTATNTIGNKFSQKELDNTVTVVVDINADDAQCNVGRNVNVLLPVK